MLPKKNLKRKKEKEGTKRPQEERDRRVIRESIGNISDHNRSVIPIFSHGQNRISLLMRLHIHSLSILQICCKTMEVTIIKLRPPLHLLLKPSFSLILITSPPRNPISAIPSPSSPCCRSYSFIIISSTLLNYCLSFILRWLSYNSS